MSLTEFAMVEELASLIKDNLPCKHLVLSVEEALVKFLQDDTSSDGVLELEPTNSYNRLLLHRLADIFGFSHQSVGEGDDRHLVLERCPETSVPSILVSDLLLQYDELHSPKVLEVLAKRKDDSSGTGLNEEKPKIQFSFEDREAAYLAARERIFSADDYETGELVKQRPQSNPVVARRMIAHALGQPIRPSNHESFLREVKVLQELDNHVKIPEEGSSNLSMQTHLDRNAMSDNHHQPGSMREESELSAKGLLNSGVNLPPEKGHKTPSMSGSSSSDASEINIQKANFRQQHMGAAKRMFASALGLHPRNSNLTKSNQTK